MKSRYILTSLYGLVLLCGCSIISHHDQLTTLQGFSNNQGDIEKYIQNQKEGFQRLRSDVQENNLTPHLTKEEIISHYGDPIVTKRLKAPTQTTEVLLYRHPTEYFSSDKIYLYLNKEYKLSHWDYIPVGE